MATELKDHNIRQLVNDLRAIAEKFHAHGSLRDRISGAVGQFIDAHFDRRAAPSSSADELPDAVISGIMGWRGPGAYTAATLRKIREVIAADRRARQGEPVVCAANCFYGDCPPCVEAGTTKVAAPADAMQQAIHALELAVIWIENIKPEELELWRVTKLGEISRDLLALKSGRAPADAPTRKKMWDNTNDEGKVGWYFDCDGHYIDVERDENGKYSVYFRNRADESEAWLDQAEDAREQQPDILKGYQTSTMVSDFNGPKITIRYDTAANADAAHEALCREYDRCRATGSNRAQAGEDA